MDSWNSYRIDLRSGGLYFSYTIHYWLHEAMGMSDRISDSAGSITIVLASVAINNFISLVIFKDISLGLGSAANQKPVEESCGQAKALN